MDNAGAAPAADPSSSSDGVADDGGGDEGRRSACFERAVAGARLIPSDGEDGRKRRRDDGGGEEGDGEGPDEKDGGKRRKADGPRVHPLAAASARLRSLGIDEMSKAINLGQLVTQGEYVGLTNVVNRNPGGDGRTGTAAPQGGAGGDDGGSPRSTGGS
ncbi:hypothetical protein THAOC_18987, partial [Thalassiosira oceanica]